MTDKKRLKGITVHRPIVYGSIATMIPVEERIANPDHNMRWTVALRSATSPTPDSDILKQRSIEGDIIGGADDLSHFIKKVSFKLHDSYPNPLRTIDRAPYEINETGWGEFLIYIKIYFVSESGEKPLQFQHGLKLHDWLPDPISIPEHQPWLRSTIPDDDDNDEENESVLKNDYEQPEQLERTSPGDLNSSNQDLSSTTLTTRSDPLSPNSSKLIHSWQYDEIVFTEPNETFYHRLLSNPMTSLPIKNRFPEDLVRQIGPKGECGEFSLEIEEKEFKKLSWAKMKVLIETDRLRGALVRSEKELNEIKRFIQKST
ncbi:YEATS domain-containing protein 4 [Phakopsora pachyrhizi]|uniref:Protein AF-9 homolog n=1 Tax=Phakopsora pachyrhizi TaxID=170000 RepID=A0AAV0AKA2_PHAPC|nr:YEATS domain-containing protein 4 [Phakopsora pachyrhizi]